MLPLFSAVDAVLELPPAAQAERNATAAAAHATETSVFNLDYDKGCTSWLFTRARERVPGARGESYLDTLGVWPQAL